MQTRDQKYAADAYKNVEKIVESERKSYGSMAHQLPILIRRAGLAQALSFVDSRDNPAQKRLLDDLAATIESNKHLIDRAREAQLSEYILLTRQVLDALLWYKRFAESILGIDTSISEEESHEQQPTLNL